MNQRGNIKEAEWFDEYGSDMNTNLMRWPLLHTSKLAH